MKANWWRGQRGEWYVAIQFLFFALVAFGPESLPGFPSWQGSGLRVTQGVSVLCALLGG